MRGQNNVLVTNITYCNFHFFGPYKKRNFVKGSSFLLRYTALCERPWSAFQAREKKTLIRKCESYKIKILLPPKKDE